MSIDASNIAIVISIVKECLSDSSNSFCGGLGFTNRGWRIEPCFKKSYRRKLLLTGRNATSHEILNFGQQLKVFYHSRLAMNPQARLDICRSCGSWVMLQMVQRQKIFIKRPLSQELPYFKLFLMYALVFKINLYGKGID